MSEKPPPKRQLGRRRRANVAGGRKHRHAVLVTPEEEALLVQRAEAQRVTVPRLLVESALSAQGETSTQRRHAMAELFAIRRALAGTVNNVNQIARVANAEGRVSAELSATLGELDSRLHAIDAAIDGLAG